MRLERKSSGDIALGVLGLLLHLTQVFRRWETHSMALHHVLCHRDTQ